MYWGEKDLRIYRIKIIHFFFEIRRKKRFLSGLVAPECIVLVSMDMILINKIKKLSLKAELLLLCGEKCANFVIFCGEKCAEAIQPN